MGILIDSNKLSDMFAGQERRGQELLPELIKRLINADGKVERIRIPTSDAILEPGFDGLIENYKGKNKYIPQGKSIWEFGTSKDIKTKFNSDYKKRTDDTSIQNKDNITFVLCSPHNWSNKTVSINEWQDEKTKEHIWKDVRAYDAEIICDWINENPEVLSWLLGSFYPTKTFKAYTLKQKYDGYNSILISKLSTEFLTCSNLENSNKLLNLINKEKVIYVKSSYGYEHCLQFVIGTFEKCGKKIKDKVIFVDSVNYLKEFQNESNDKIYIHKSFSDLSYNDENTHIILLDNANKINPNISLGYCVFNELRESLLKSKISYDLTDEIMDSVGNNPILIYKKLINKNNRHLSSLNWLSNEIVNELIPLAFMEHIDFTNKTDETHFSKFNLCNFNEYKDKLDKWFKVENTPIIKIGYAYKMVGLDVFFTFYEFTVKEVNDILSIIDSYFNDNLYSFFDEDFLTSVFNGIERLFTISSNDEIKNVISGWCRILIPKLFENKNINNLIRYSSYLSEFNRDAYLSYIEDNLSNEFINIISDNNSICFKDNWTFFILSLEKCLWFSDSLIRTLRLMIKLSSHSIDQVSDRINEIIIDCIMPLSYTYIPKFSLEERKYFIDLFYKEIKDYEPLLKLLGYHYPSFCIVKAPKNLSDDEKCNFNRNEYLEIQNFVIDVLLENVDICKWLSDFIDSTDYLKENEYKLIFEKIKNNVKKLDDESRSSLKGIILKEIFNIKRFSDNAEWKRKTKLIPYLHELLTITEPKDNFLSLKYIFTTPSYDLPIENPILYSQDFDNVFTDADSKREKMIENAIDELFNFYKDETYKLILNTVDDSSVQSYILYLYQKTKDKESLIRLLIENNFKCCLYKLLHEEHDEIVISYLKIFKKYPLFLSSLPVKKNVLSLLTKEQEKIYWKACSSYNPDDKNDFDYVYQKEKEYNNNVALINLLFYKPRNSQYILNFLTSLDINSIELNKENIHKLRELIKALETSDIEGKEESLFTIESKFLTLYEHKDFPKGIKEHFWNKPISFVDWFIAINENKKLKSFEIKLFFTYKFAIDDVKLVKQPKVFENWVTSIISYIENKEDIIQYGCIYMIYKIISKYIKLTSKENINKSILELLDKIIKNKDEEFSFICCFINLDNIGEIRDGSKYSDLSIKYKIIADDNRLLEHVFNIFTYIYKEYENDKNEHYKDNIIMN